MKKRIVWLVVLLCLVSLSLAARADNSLTIGGKPFPGHVVKAGDRTFVDVEPLIKALGLYHQREAGGYYLFLGRADASKRAMITMRSQVVVVDKMVDTQTADDGAVMVDLQQTADALGLTFDGTALSVPTTSVASASGPQTSTAAVIPLLMVGDQSGKELDLWSLKIKGRFNVFYFYYEGHAKCKEIAPDMRKFLARWKDEPLVRIVLVDVGFQDSPIDLQYGVRSLPAMIVTNRAGAFIAANPGHSTRALLNDLNFLKTMQNREAQGLTTQ